MMFTHKQFTLALSSPRRRGSSSINFWIMKVLLIFFLTTFINAEEFSSKQSYSKQDMINFLRPFLSEKISTKEFDIAIEKMPTDGVSENDNLEGATIDDLVIPPQQRSFQVSLKLKSGEKFSCSGKIEWLANIPILLRPIGPSDIINVSDVGYQSYPVDQLTAMIVMDSNDLVGKSSAHTMVKPGLPVERSQLKNPTIIRRGDMINVVYRSQCLIVSAKAQATQDLACGDTGTFETQHANSNQTKKISAKVVGPSTAEILHGLA